MTEKKKTTKQDVAAVHARSAVGEIADQLSALTSMTAAELKTRYEEVFGEPSRSSNKDYLRKKIAWRIQELAEGGLSDKAKQRIEELSVDAPLRYKKSTQKPSFSQGTPVHPLDPRLPLPDSIITKEHKGVTHKVTVLADGFQYKDKPYRSLSKIAREITGTSWNGFLFFGLTEQSRKTTR